MKIVRPLTVTDAMLVSSDLTEDDHAAWDVATTYARGDYVISTDTHTVYRSLQDSNTGNDPDLEQVALADPLIDDPSTVYWQVMGATNLWRLFDQKPSVQTSSGSTFAVTVAPNSIVSGIGVFNVSGANSVDIEMINDGETVYSASVQMTDESVVIDGWTYFFTEIEPLPNFVLTDLPPYPTAQMEITFNGSSIGVGQVAFGPIWDVGYVEIGGTGFEGLDFSGIGVDDYGNLTTVKRAATNVHRFDLVLPVHQSIGFNSRMNQLRGGTPAIWVADNDRRKSATAYGFYRSYKTIYSEGDESIIAVEVQGIV